MYGLDYETFSEVDIKRHGLDRYINDPSFTPLIAALVTPNGTDRVYDFVLERSARDRLRADLLMAADPIAAHNAGFERAVIKHMQIELHSSRIWDSAVIARAAGAGSSLAAAAPQLLRSQKLDEGRELIKLFSVPNAQNQGRPFTADEIRASTQLSAKWALFIDYCIIDASLSRKIAMIYSYLTGYVEQEFEQQTQKMNDVGWFVDLPLVHQMKMQYDANKEDLLAQFQRHYGDINLQSYKQLQEWCAARGVHAKSFDKLNLEKMRRQLERRLEAPAFLARVQAGELRALSQQQDYGDVLSMVRLKQELGGSSLSKLQTIIDMTGVDGRLRNQYMHLGAGQTFRTSGRGVQLQNLARLHNELGDVESLMPDEHGYTQWWDNDKLAHNIRQCFRAEHPQGELIVGDFSAVESRGLAFLAGEQWKLDAYTQGKDIYKMLATTYSSNHGVAYADVTKEQRQGGKVGELACGYGAGPSAVQGFAEKMGMEMSEQEAGQIVRDWRDANPNIVRLWNRLNEMLLSVVQSKQEVARLVMKNGGSILLQAIDTPQSLTAQHPGAQSIKMIVLTPNANEYMSRVFHGCYMRGNDVCYYKPSELKSGNLWRARMTQPPHIWYKLYGGKLAGILTQSFCRELFFNSMTRLDKSMERFDNIKLIGQFHDELVVEWTPPTKTLEVSLDYAKELMERHMSNPAPWTQFPLVADIKSAHRYIK